MTHTGWGSTGDRYLFVLVVGDVIILLLEVTNGNRECCELLSKLTKSNEVRY